MEEREWCIHHIEEFYCNRMTELVDNEQYDDAHSIFEEFVVNGEEPEEYVFLEYSGSKYK
jgi:hypothetical protein